jgi:hypothetical protein
MFLLSHTSGLQWALWTGAKSFYVVLMMLCLGILANLVAGIVNVVPVDVPVWAAGGGPTCKY